MNRWRWFRDALRHSSLSVGLLSAHLACVGLLAWQLGGGVALLIAAVVTLLGLIAAGPVPEDEGYRAAGARRLTARAFPRLGAMVRDCALSAGLSHIPRLYLVPVRGTFACTSGVGPQSVIGLSSTLIRTSSPRELRCVIAHEVGHIAHNDVRVMTLVGFWNRFGTAFRVWVVPLMLLTGWRPGALSILIVVLAPTLMQLLYYAMCRTRELKADLLAARLTAAPLEVARALAASAEEDDEAPGWTSTHPPVATRIERLNALAA